MGYYRHSRARGFGGRNNRSNGQYRPSGFRGRNGNRNKGEDLNPMMFVLKAVPAEEEVYVPKKTFSDFGFSDQLKRNISGRGYTRLTPIQDQAMGLLLEGRDLVGLANTGTGKTAAFLLPLINKVSRDRREKVLIVAPTRELAMQIQDELRQFCGGIGIGSVLCIGGASIGQQIEGLRRGPNFVIGTPGRIKDLEQRRVLRLGEYNNVVLDEVDRMLDMGFIHDVRRIVSKLPKQRQSLFFSATLPEKTKDLMKEFLVNPVTVSVTNGATARNVDQDIIRVGGRDKVEILHQLLREEGFNKVLVFGRTKWGINKLEKALLDRGHRTAAIHGNKSQGQRTKALAMLKNNQIRILLATDVAARGIDVSDITYVINYDVPGSYDDYVHRIGRTGRAGKPGVALTFVD